VEQTQIAIQQATGILPTCLRPPYGATDPTTFQMAEELGLDITLWTIDTQDWRRPGTEAIVEHILDSVVPGAIILMHDGGGERSQTIAALEQVLPQLAAQGYVFERLCR
jgi:peptidoglycan/xylan/chitin deacetylase (PgdA/CDA1 family)